MNWASIKSVEAVEVGEGLLPFRARLTRSDGSEVEAGGRSSADAVVMLFATARYGSFAPGVLAEIIERKLSGKVSGLDKVIDALLSR